MFQYGADPADPVLHAKSLAEVTRGRQMMGAGAAVALEDCLRVLKADGAITAWPLRQLVGAVSVGVVNGEPRVDLCYEEDAAADVDMNVVMSASGDFVEVQGAAEGAPFARATLDAMCFMPRR